MSADLLLRYPGFAARSRIDVERGGLARLGAFTRAVTGARRVVVVSDTHVAALYGAPALRALRRAGVAADLVRVPAGERSKSPARLAALWHALASHGLGRRDALVALGGGVVGDLAGFAAATYLRGVEWVAVPTTVLAQVDSSVGGKTGIDLAAGKNLAGAFHQPAGVLVDPDTLATLPARQRRAGLAEVVKAGMAADAALFRWTESRAERLAAGGLEALAGVVVRAIRVKARIVTADEREREGGRRTALNYGHTLAHAIEAARGYRGPLHGEAVAIGMRAAAALSVEVAGLPAAARARQDALLDRLGLPRRMPATPIERLLAAIAHDKKRAARGARWVLTTRVGHASVPRLISGRLVRSALLQAGAEA
ncbi:MAG TPA: 3-dehydroquinate synthase [Candidatus Eisenbacteria bacterium]